MAAIDVNTNQATIGSLRSVRRKLYSIPESDLDAMSQEGQVKYGDSLHQCGLAILKLEAAQLKVINDEFKTKEQELKKAAMDMENDLAELTDATKVIRVVSEGIALVTDIVKFLG